MNGLSYFSSRLPDDPQELTGLIGRENLPETQVRDVARSGPGYSPDRLPPGESLS